MHICAFFRRGRERQPSQLQRLPQDHTKICLEIAYDAVASAHHELHRQLRMYILLLRTHPAPLKKKAEYNAFRNSTCQTRLPASQRLGPLGTLWWPCHHPGSQKMTPERLLELVTPKRQACMQNPTPHNFPSSSLSKVSSCYETSKSCANGPKKQSRE